jgi:hypothetical protein
MKWVITGIETKTTEQHPDVVTRVFFNVFADDETDFFFSGDALLSEPIYGFTELSQATNEDILKWLFFSIGESSVAFYERNAMMCKANKKSQ